MEDKQKGGASASQQQNGEPQFKVSDIKKTQANQSNDLKMNVHETRVGKFKKSSAQAGNWVHKHHKKIVIIIIAAIVAVVGITVLVVGILKWQSASQDSNEPSNPENAVVQNESINADDQKKLDDVVAIQNHASELLNSDPNNANAVVSYYDSLIDSAIQKSDWQSVYNLLTYETDLLGEKNLDRTAVEVLQKYLGKVTDSKVQAMCKQRIYYFANRLGDEGLKAQYESSIPDTQSLRRALEERGHSAEEIQTIIDGSSVKK